MSFLPDAEDREGREDMFAADSVSVSEPDWAYVFLDLPLLLLFFVRTVSECVNSCGVEQGSWSSYSSSSFSASGSVP